MKHLLSKVERDRHKYYIRDAVRQLLEDNDTMAHEWIFRSARFDTYCREAGVCPKSVRDVTKKLLVERDSKLEKFEYVA